MAVAWGSVTSAAVNSAGSSGVTVTKPTSVANGDVLYAFCSRTVYSDTTPFTCSGWTDISPATTGSVSGNDRQLTILRKVITDAGNEAADYTFVVTGMAVSARKVGIIVRVSGADTTTPEDITVPAYGLVGNDATPLSADANSVTDNALVLSYCQLSLDTTTETTWGPPSGYTHGDSNFVSPGTLNNQSGVAYKTQVTAGAVGTNVWTHTPNDATTETLVAVVIVRPAPSTNPIAIISRF